LDPTVGPYGGDRHYHVIERVGTLLVGGGGVRPNRALRMPRDVHPPHSMRLIWGFRV
jgi:hypothetical protein